MTQHTISTGMDSRTGGRSCPVLYSTACSYAVRAMCRLALIRPHGYVKMNEVCEGSDLPAHFVAKIFGDLVSTGLLKSAKGRGGGYTLTRPASEIMLGEIVDAIDGMGQYTRCVVGLNTCDDAQPCPQHEHFKPVRIQMLRYLNTTTLDQMSDALAKKLELVGSPPA